MGASSIHDIAAARGEMRVCISSAGIEAWIYATIETSPAAQPIEMGMNKHANWANTKHR